MIYVNLPSLGIFRRPTVTTLRVLPNFLMPGTPALAGGGSDDIELRRGRTANLQHGEGGGGAPDHLPQVIPYQLRTSASRRKQLQQNSLELGRQLLSSVEVFHRHPMLITTHL